MRLLLTTVGTLLCALLSPFFTLSITAQGEEQSATKHCVAEVSEYDWENNARAINECASKKVPVFVPCGVYVIMEQIVMINVPLFTSKGCSATFIAHPSLGNRRMLYFYSVVPSEIAFLEFDGNKEERMRYAIDHPLSEWSELGDREDMRPANLEIHGQGVNAHDIVSRNAVSGSCFGILGENLTIQNNTVSDCGFADGERPGRSHQWADGFTFVYCYRCVIAYNKAYNVTDLGFVWGGGGYNLIYGNYCRNDKTFGFGCFNYGWFDTGHHNPRTGIKWDGNHEGNMFEKNIAFAEPGKLIYGISFGRNFFIMDPPKSGLADIGIARNNESFGAHIPLSFGGVMKGSAHGNLFGHSRKARQGAYNHCDTPHDFIAGDIGSGLKLQAGWEAMTMNGGVCKKY